MLIDGIASLSIKSLTHPAADVTAIIGLEPTSLAERGDPVGRIRTGADGKPSMRERTHSIWALDVIGDDPDDTTGLSSVRAIVALLEPRRAALDTLAAHYFVEIRWSGYSDRPQAGFLIPSDLLGPLGALGIDFHGTVYLHDEPEEDEAPGPLAEHAPQAAPEPLTEHAPQTAPAEPEAAPADQE